MWEDAIVADPGGCPRRNKRTHEIIRQESLEPTKNLK